MGATHSGVERGKRIRREILAFIESNDGRARCREVAVALHAKGLDIDPKQVSRYLNHLIKDGRLVKTSLGMYWLLSVLATEKEAKIAMMPFGTTLKGRILYIMVHEGESLTSKITKRLIAQGVKVADHYIENAMHELRRTGYIRKLGYGSSVPSESTLEKLGLKHRDIDKAEICSWTKLQNDVMYHLVTFGRTTVAKLTSLYVNPEHKRKWWAIHNALDVLIARGYAKRAWRGTYESTGKPYPFKTKAVPVAGGKKPRFDSENQYVRLLVPFLTYLREHGETKSLVLTKRFCGKGTISARAMTRRAFKSLMQHGFVSRARKGYYAATNKPGLPAGLPPALTDTSMSGSLTPAQPSLQA